MLKPNLQPSAYYGRRPLANYIRKGRSIGICVCRGFNQDIWDRLHPSKTTPAAIKAREGVSTSQAGVSPRRRQQSDPTLAQSERPQVTDLVLVIHGIGQKLSERIETYHFTHAINSFRREVNVELGTDSVKSHLRKDMGGIMVLPVCHTCLFKSLCYLSQFEETFLSTAIEVAKPMSPLLTWIRSTGDCEFPWKKKQMATLTSLKIQP